MSWKANRVEDRTAFIAGCLAGEETMTALAARFGVSRKTAHKWWARYQAEGFGGLVDRRREALTIANRTEPAVVAAVLEARSVHQTWGARKLAHLIDKPQGFAERWPSVSTIGRILHDAELTRPQRRRRRSPACTTAVDPVQAANDEWAGDGKGNFLTGDGRRCDPFVIIDSWSRMLLVCSIVPSWSHAAVQSVMARCFAEYGLPRAIRTDNGPPFARPGAGGLSPLSIWWIKLGIIPVRTRPGHPQDNGKVERMNRTLGETCRQPAADSASQQARFDAFRQEYNLVRPHQALGFATPAQRYTPSPRPLGQPRSPDYKDGTIVRQIRHNGELRWNGQLIYICKLLAGEPVAIVEAEGGLDVWYGPVDLGRLDLKGERLVKPRR
jgi:transposase InsO family protein